MSLNLVVGQKVLDKFQKPGGSTPIDHGEIRLVTDEKVVIDWKGPSFKAATIPIEQAKALLVNDNE